jgi:hypothetical protein
VPLSQLSSLLTTLGLLRLATGSQQQSVQHAAPLLKWPRLFGLIVETVRGAIHYPRRASHETLGLRAGPAYHMWRRICGPLCQQAPSRRLNKGQLAQRFIRAGADEAAARACS